MQQSNACLLSRVFLDYCTRSAEEPIVAVDGPHKDQSEHIQGIAHVSPGDEVVRPWYYLAPDFLALLLGASLRMAVKSSSSWRLLAILASSVLSASHSCLTFSKMS